MQHKLTSGLGGLSTDELAYYGDGTWYDAEYVHIGGDVLYYAGIAATSPGPVLELACGTGRLTIPMAEMGGTVVGVDVAPGMIARAQEKWVALDPSVQERLTFIEGDMRTLDLGRTFPRVVLAFNTLMHMTEDDDLRACLETVRRHLAPGGKFYLDVHTPHPAVAPRDDPDGRFDPQQMIDPRNGRRYVVSENNSYDARTQINVMRFFYQEVDAKGRKFGAEWKRELRLRVIFPRELDLWLSLAGLDIIGDWNDFEGQHEFDAEGGRRVIVCTGPG